MNIKKKLHIFIRHPFASSIKILRYIVLRPRFRRYSLSAHVKGIKYISCRFVSLGREVFIGPRCRVEGIIAFEGVSYNPNIVFEEGVSVRQDLYLTCASNIVIGANTAIAAFVTITDIDHSYSDINLPIERQKLRVSEVSIGSDCKIYNGAVITMGSRIGHHCVIGANSVVKGIYPDYCVIVGNPSKIVKRYDPELKTWRRTDHSGNFIEENHV